MGLLKRKSPLWAVPAVLTAMSISVSTAGDRPAGGTVASVSYADAPPAAAALASLPAGEKEKLGWVLWIWDDQSRSDPGQTFRLARDETITGISILVASAENLGREPFRIEFEGFNDIDADVVPVTEELAVYRGRLPDDFDRQSPGKWVTFRLSRPMKLSRDRGYAFRFAFDRARDYDLRRAFLRATNTDDAGQPRSAVAGRLTRQTSDRHYATWGSVEDMMFALRTDALR